MQTKGTPSHWALQTEVDFASQIVYSLFETQVAKNVELPLGFFF